MKVFTRICLSIGLISLGLGIGLLIIASVIRPTPQHISAFSQENMVGDVRELDIRIDFGEITITEGKEFMVEAENLYDEDSLETYVSDGVWVIKQTNSSFDLFGYKIPISFGIGVYRSPSIRITVPKGFHSENIKVFIDAGRLKAKNLSSDKGSFTVKAGSLEIDGIVIEEESTYFVDAGNINLKGADIKNIKVGCDVGAVFIEGAVTGDNEIGCEVGIIRLDLEDNMDFYSFDIDSDLGNVIINNRTYNNKRIKNNSTRNKGSFLINVDVGNVTMDFNEY